MTGYRVNTGASKKFVAGWDSIFGDVKPSSSKKKDWKGKEKKGKGKKAAAARPKVTRSEESKEEQEVV